MGRLSITAQMNQFFEGAKGRGAIGLMSVPRSERSELV